jgi:PAS domain S-box-containing protein
MTQTPLRVLMVEDQEDDAALILRELKRGGYAPDAVRVDCAEDMGRALDEHTFELVISDHNMPRFSAPEALELLHNRGLDLPFVIVSGSIGEDTAVASMKAGAHDYVVKDSLRRLVPVVQRELREATIRSERKRADAALRESERRFQLIGRATEEVIWDWDLSTQRMHVSDAITRKYGYAVSTITREWWNERIHPSDRGHVEKYLKDVLSRGDQVWVDEYRFLKADGTWANVLDRGFVVREGAEKPGRMVGSMIDLTSQKASEDALRQSELRFRALIEQSPDLVVVVRDDRLIYVNPTLVRTLGYDAVDELAGAPLSGLFSADDVDAMREASAQVMTSGMPSTLPELRVKRRDGKPLWVELALQRVVFDGAPALLATARDLTERRALTSKLMQMDRMVAVGTLAAGVGHEINNPLAYIIANIGFLERELPRALERLRTLPNPEDVGPLVEKLSEFEKVLLETRDGANRVRDIVRDLKTFSRGDEETLGPTDLAQVLESSLNMAHNEIRHRARLSKDYGADLWVHANGSRLGQVFLNLLVNAAQAIREGNADKNEVTLRAWRHGSTVTVTISDTGEGIAPQNLSRIFDAFFTTKPVGQGTGLGLAICQTIVRSFGGELSVQSVVGKGSTFRVQLPVSEQPAKAKPVARPVSEPTQRGKLLIVDDEPVLGIALKRLLSKEHDVVTATSGQQALKLLDEGQQFDLVCCDLMMPEMTGMDLYDELEKKRPEVTQRMIFMTGGAFTHRAQTFLERVQNPRVEKPIDLELFRTQVSRFLTGKLDLQASFAGSTRSEV